MEKTAKELGEFGIITEIISKFSDSAKLGKFEDSLEFPTHNSENMLLNIDNLPGHLLRDNLSENKFLTAGHVCVTSSVHDIIVSGGKPLYFGTKIIIPETMKESEISDFFQGMKRALNIYGMKNLGGDTDVSDIEKLDVTTIALGTLEKNSSKFSRNTAKENDIIFLTSASGIGWSNLVMRKKVNKNIKEKEYVDFWNKHKQELESVEIFPKLPVNAFLECSKNNLLTSATDVTDGIGEVYDHDYKPRNMGMELKFKKEHLAKCAVDVLDKEKIHPVNAFINHGMDMPAQALITCSLDKKDQVIKIFQENKVKLHEIGKVIKKPVFQCSYESETLDIKNPPYNDGSSVNPLWYQKS